MLFRAARQWSEIEQRFPSSGGGRGRYGNFTCQLNSAPWTESIEVVQASDANSGMFWFASICKGMIDALPEAISRGMRLCSLRVTITHVQHHPVDSSARGFELRGNSFILDYLKTAYLTTLEPPSSTWLTDVVIGLARAIADDNANAHPILADALEEAGCADSLWLDHLRQCPDHQNNCWVAQLIMQQWASLNEKQS